MRCFLDISYDGRDFHGWQSQKNAYSVQQAIEEALEQLLQQKVSITGSGRTDTGVHALQQSFCVQKVHSRWSFLLAQRAQVGEGVAEVVKRASFA